ncbi:MAG: putative redox protein [Neolewinella sp.]|jgi:putative redox protein
MDAPSVRTLVFLALWFALSIFPPSNPSTRSSNEANLVTHGSSINLLSQIYQSILMTVNLHRLDDAFHLQATNEHGRTVETDAGLTTGGKDAGMRPMELLLAAVGSCSSIDIIMLLKKQRQDLQDIRIVVTGTRRDEEPRIFTGIHVAYTLVGGIDEKKAERACRLSMEKMCSVSLMLKAGGVMITWEYEVVVE